MTMVRRSISSLITLAVLAACAAPPAAKPMAPASGSDTPPLAAQQPIVDAAARRSELDGDAAPASADVAAAVPAPQGPASLPFEFWKEESFQKRFEESFLRESDVEPPATRPEVEVLQEAARLLGENEVEKAMARLRNRQDDESTAAIDYMLGNLHFQAERLADAAAEYEKAVAKYGKFRRAWKNLALVRMRLQQYPAAADAFVHVITLGGGDALVYGLLGFAHGNAEDHIAAESAYRMAAMLDPYRLDWRVGMGRAFFRQRRFGEAVSLCASMIAQNPDRADLWMLQANAYVGLGDNVKAAENLEMVDRLGGATVESLALLGDIYINEGLYDLAADAHLRAVAKDQKGDSKRALGAANQLAMRSAHAESLRLLAGVDEKFGATMSETEKKDLLKLRARLSVATGATEDEVALLQQVITMDPLDGDALILLGQHYQRAGDKEKAILRFQQAGEIEAFAARAKVEHAKLLAGEGRYAEALPLLRAAQKLDPRDFVQKFLDDVEKAAARGR
ncbi:MAG: tetratricopeptide repeat protein [Planctomycetota bacterium]